MDNAQQIRVTDSVRVPLSELEISYTRSSGPGGQHVNKTSSAVVLRWNVNTSSALNETQRARVSVQLANQINLAGELMIEADEQRSQLQNRDVALERFASTLARALVIPKHRKATRPSRASKERRLDSKRQTSDRKRSRKVFD